MSWIALEVLLESVSALFGFTDLLQLGYLRNKIICYDHCRAQDRTEMLNEIAKFMLHVWVQLGSFWWFLSVAWHAEKVVWCQSCAEIYRTHFSSSFFVLIAGMEYKREVFELSVAVLWLSFGAHWHLVNVVLLSVVKVVFKKLSIFLGVIVELY